MLFHKGIHNIFLMNAHCSINQQYIGKRVACDHSVSPGTGPYMVGPEKWHLIRENVAPPGTDNVVDDVDFLQVAGSAVRYTMQLL